jgi:long-chain-fatty-acid--CoA ligase ACSBG
MAFPMVYAGVLAAGVAYAAMPPSAQPYRKYVEQDASLNARYPKGKRLYSTLPNEPVEFEAAECGPASETYPHMVESLRQAVAAFPDAPALMYEKPGYPADKIGEWETITWSQYQARARSFAKALLGLGFEPFHGVCICGFNSPAWFIAHMGAMMAQGLSAGCYTTNSDELCQYVAEHSRSEVVVVDNVKNMEKFLMHKDDLPLVKRVVVYLEAVPDDVKAAHGNYVLSFDEFLAIGAPDLASDILPEAEAEGDAALDARIAAIDPRHCSTLIYTSGTTGNPKGVMISHDSMNFICKSAMESTEMHQGTTPWHSISYLPMSHIAAQAADVAFPIHNAAVLGRNHTVWFGRPDALKGSLPLTLKAVRPTMFFGVPRVWEKFAEAIKAKSKAAPATGLKLKLVTFAKRVGAESSAARQVGGDGRIPRGCGIASRLVHSKVKEALGLDRCFWHMTGAAPIQRETLDFMASLGIDILELYGMSETCGPATMSAAFRFKFGACGFRLQGCELKLDHVEGRDKEGEGEICFRGRHVMMGYLYNEAKTAETIDKEGWLHSGDVGSIDDEGMLRITGRIKELIIGAGGENIAPVPIEDAIKSRCPGIANIVMVGDKRKYNVALVSVKCTLNLETGEPTDQLAGEALEVNPGLKTVSEAIVDDTWKQYIEAGIAQYNASPQCPSNAQKIQKFCFMPADLSIPGGELTGTMKMKRDFIAQKYATLIESMY